MGEFWVVGGEKVGAQVGGVQAGRRGGPKGLESLGHEGQGTRGDGMGVGTSIDAEDALGDVSCGGKGGQVESSERR